MIDFLRKNRISVLIIFILFATFCKLIATNFLYTIPMGYDAGMYRFLFMKYAMVEQFFAFPELIGWETRQSPVLLWIIGRIIHLGVPVDFILTWGWSICMFLLIASYTLFAYITEGKKIALGVIIAGLSSLSFYEVYSYMYWKTAAALLCFLLCLHLLQKNRYIPALLVIVFLAGIHHLTAFFAVILFCCWWLILLFSKRIAVKKWSWYTLVYVFIILCCCIWYIDSLDFVLSQLRNIFLRESTKPSSFATIPTLISHSLFILSGAMVGVYSTYKKQGITIWHTGFALAALLVLIQIYFYRRFYILFDFMGMYLFAHGAVYIWDNTRLVVLRICVIALVCINAIWSFSPILKETFTISEAEFEQITQLSAIIPEGTTVIVPENLSAFYVAGWLIGRNVRAPGLLNDPLSYAQWQQLLFGNQEKRRAIIAQFPEDSIILTLPAFYRFYGNKIENFLADSCFLPSVGSPILTIECN